MRKGLGTADFRHLRAISQEIDDSSWGCSPSNSPADVIARVVRRGAARVPVSRTPVARTTQRTVDLPPPRLLWAPVALGSSLGRFGGRFGGSGLVSRHGSHLAVGVGSVRGEVLVGDLRDRASRTAAGLPPFVVSRCRFREVRSLRRGGRRHRCRRAGAGVRDDSSRLGRIRLVERWAAGHEVDRARALEATYTWARAAVARAVGANAVWAALLLVVVGAIAGATGSRLVQYGILGAVVGIAVQLIAVHSFVEASTATGQGRPRR